MQHTQKILPFVLVVTDNMIENRVAMSYDAELRLRHVMIEKARHAYQFQFRPSRPILSICCDQRPQPVLDGFPCQLPFFDPTPQANREQIVEYRADAHATK